MACYGDELRVRDLSLNAFTSQLRTGKEAAARARLEARAAIVIQRCVRRHLAQCAFVDRITALLQTRTPPFVAACLLLGLSQRVSIPPLLRDPQTMQRVVSTQNASDDKLAALQTLLKTGVPYKPKSYWALDPTVDRWRRTRPMLMAGVKALPDFWATPIRETAARLSAEPIDSVERVLVLLKLLLFDPHPDVCERAVQLFPELPSSIAFKRLCVAWPPNYVAQTVAQSLAQGGIGPYRTMMNDTSPLTKQVWAVLLYCLALTDNCPLRTVSSVIEALWERGLFDPLCVEVPREVQVRSLFLLAQCAATCSDSAQRLPAAARHRTCVTALIRHITASLYKCDADAQEKIVGCLRRQSVMQEILKEESLEKYKLLFPANRINSFFRRAALSQPVSGQRHFRVNFAEFLLMEDEYEDQDEEVGGEPMCSYTVPYDEGLFDIMISAATDDVWRQMVGELGARLWRADSLETFVRNDIGAPPAFDNSLMFRVFVSYLQRRLLIMNDADFFDPLSAQDSQAAFARPLSELWTELGQFPLRSLAHVRLLVSFVNHVAFQLSMSLGKYLQMNKQALTPAAKTGHYLLEDTFSLARQLSRRLERLDLPVEWMYMPVMINSTGLPFDRVKLAAEMGAPNAEWARMFSALSLSARAELTNMGTLCHSLVSLPQSIPFELRTQLLRDVLPVSRRLSGPTVLIRRSHMLEDAFASLPSLRQGRNTSVRITFVDETGMNEAGIDGGGLTREFLLILSNILADRDFNLFGECQNHTLTPNVIYDEYESSLLKPTAAMLFELCGLLCGMAFQERIVLSAFEFSPLFLNRLLGNSNSLDDLRSADKEMYNSIMRIKSLAASEDVSKLGLPFTATVRHKELVKEVPLEPNGAEKTVDNESCTHFCILLTNYLVNRQFDKCAAAMMEGLKCYVDPRWLKLFNAQEFGTLIAGKPEWDVSELRMATTYQDPYNARHPAIVGFWQILEAQNSNGEFKKAFLKFVFAYDRPPLLGFEALSPPFAIGVTQSASDLPTASTCVNLLKLPNISDTIELSRRLLTAVYNAQTFELS